MVLVPICIWENSSIKKGCYKIKARVDLLGDAFPENNEATTTSSPLYVSIAGDIASLSEGLGIPGGKVDIKDLAAIAKEYGRCAGDPKYNAVCDIIYDEKTDIKDLACVALHYGQIDP